MLDKHCGQKWWFDLYASREIASILIFDALTGVMCWLIYSRGKGLYTDDVGWTLFRQNLWPHFLGELLHRWTGVMCWLYVCVCVCVCVYVYIMTLYMYVSLYIYIYIHVLIVYLFLDVLISCIYANIDMYWFYWDIFVYFYWGILVFWEAILTPLTKPALFSFFSKQGPFSVCPLHRPHSSGAPVGQVLLGLCGML